MNYFASLGIFMGQGRSREVTKSLHRDYGIEGKFASEWRDWRTLKGTLVRDLIEKRNVKKSLFLIGTTTAKQPHGLQWYGNLQSLVRCIEIVVDTPDMRGQTGQCDKNPDWMLVNCKKSCSSKITDSNPSCPAWAKLGECTKNPNGMLPNCKLSCMRISARTEWSEIIIWLFIIILTVH